MPSPTIKIVDKNGNIILSNQSLANISTGLYIYTLSTSQANQYVGIAYTSDVNADEQNLASWTHNNIVENLNDKVGNPRDISQSSLSDITSGVWSNEERTLTSISELLESFWTYSVRALTSSEATDVSNRFILFMGKILDEYINLQGYMGSTDGQYEKLAKEVIQNNQ